MTNPTTFLDQVDEIVLSNLQHRDLLQLIAQHFQLSDSQIYRKFKHKSGLSPSIYIRQKRLVIAKDLILRSDMTFTEIAHYTGFQQLAYFSRCFSEHYEMTPTEVRRKRDQGQLLNLN